jgi:hypothetical protein
MGEAAAPRGLSIPGFHGHGGAEPASGEGATRSSRAIQRARVSAGEAGRVMVASVWRSPENHGFHRWARIINPPGKRLAFISRLMDFHSARCNFLIHEIYGELNGAFG